MYELALPHSSLRGAIQCYWRVKQTGPGAAIQEQIWMDGCADLIFNFGVAYQRTPTGAHSTSIRHSNLDGQRNYAVKIAQAGSIFLVGIRFQPGGLRRVAKLPAQQVTGQIVSPIDVFGHAITTVEGRLWEAPALHECAQLLDAFFRQRLVSPSSWLADETAYVIHSARGQVSITALSRQLGYSQRHIDRLFINEYGFSPKTYARICRGQSALRQLDSGADLLQVAADHGFHDQAHLTHELRRLTGLTPTEYLSKPSRPSNPQEVDVQFLQRHEQ